MSLIIVPASRDADGALIINSRKRIEETFSPPKLTGPHRGPQILSALAGFRPFTSRENLSNDEGPREPGIPPVCDNFLAVTRESDYSCLVSTGI